MTAFDTRDASSGDARRTRDAAAGLVVVFCSAQPTFIPLAFDRGRLVMGRSIAGGLLVPDERMSREHAAIREVGDRWVVRDMGSRNGTFVDGVQIHGEVEVPRPRVVRLGDTLVVPCADVTRATRSPDGDGVIVGAALREAFAAIDRAAKLGDTLLVRGESGTGKELGARRYHASGPRASGPFIAVNCAAIPEGLAERLLFGTMRGAYSGANADAAGHVEMAHGGTLFLDEAGELDLDVQAKLLRILETREVVRLGASIGRRVDVHVCLATNRDLRRRVAEGKFRADLYHRVCPPEVVLPALRDRLDEIPRHVAAEVARADRSLRPHPRFVEACILRAWPGNVRELRKEVFHAAVRARDEGAERVRADHLGEHAGAPIPSVHDSSRPPALGGDDHLRRPYVKWSQKLSKDAIQRALEEHEGNVSRAASSLGMRRTQLYREMDRFDVKGKRGA